MPNVIELLTPPDGISVTITAELPQVNGDTVRLTQVFQNLLENAIKFMGSPEGHVDIGYDEMATYWQFWIKDTGLGIAPQYYKKIFHMFQTLHPRDEYESTGIGLALVKKIIEFHGGKVWVKSTPGAGSTFYFTLPKSSGPC